MQKLTFPFCDLLAKCTEVTRKVVLQFCCKKIEAEFFDQGVISKGERCQPFTINLLKNFNGKLRYYNFNDR